MPINSIKNTFFPNQKILSGCCPHDIIRSGFQILLISLFALLYFEFSLLIFMALVLFSAILLFIIINIRLLYLENARTAGYAYHSLVIFSILMIGNFYLVGPLVIFGLLIYLSWLSYRQFVN